MPFTKLMFGMQLLNPISLNFNPTCKSASPSFTGFVPDINFTQFFRDDIKSWEKVINKFSEMAKDVPQMHSYCLASSKGHEVFSYVMMIMEKLKPEEAKKFLPIKAIDIDEKAIKEAQSGIVRVSEGDIRRIIDALGDNYKKYIDFDYDFGPPELNNRRLCNAKIAPEVMDKIIFKQADALDFVKEIEPENSIVLGRNFWPYLSEDMSKQIKLSEALGEKLQKNSAVMLGEYDLIQNSADALVLDTGFDISDVDYVYQKGVSAQREFLSNPDFLKANFIPTKK